MPHARRRPRTVHVPHHRGPLGGPLTDFPPSKGTTGTRPTSKAQKWPRMRCFSNDLDSSHVNDCWPPNRLPGRGLHPYGAHTCTVVDKQDPRVPSVRPGRLTQQEMVYRPSPCKPPPPSILINNPYRRTCPDWTPIDDTCQRWSCMLRSGTLLCIAQTPCMAWQLAASGQNPLSTSCMPLLTVIRRP
ncbi:hypothetical protein LZ30DRAFT_238034 [Colletotrichum cereale]|nr:hypothetical protein LZ30DRAFT_238034 [Colletotrichum cereale]